MQQGVCVAACLASLTLSSVAAWGAMPTTDAEAVKQALWLEGTGHLAEGKELLERWAIRSPESELVAMARARLYLAENNPFWALKVLGAVLEAHPGACEARAFAAKIHISQANLEQATELLATRPCQLSEALTARYLLLEAEIAELRGNRAEASRRVADALSKSERYQEDDARLRALERAYDPYRVPLWTLEAKLSGGYATTAMGQAPVDVKTPVSPPGGAVTQLELRGRATLPFRRALRPIVELELKAVQYLTEQARNLSLRQPTLRLGAVFGRGYPLLTLNYAYELTDFEAPASSQFSADWYSTAHFGQYRFELGPSFQSFGSVGYRQLSDDRLSRFESEHGLLKLIALSDTADLSLGAKWRVSRARLRAFDQVGVGGFAGLTVRLPNAFELRESIALSHDRFPASYGYEAPDRAARQDLGLRVQATLDFPPVYGVRPSLGYDYASRDSRVSTYDYSDHRVLVGLEYRLNRDEVAGKRISDAGRVPLRHETDPPEVSEPEELHLRDRVRKDDEMRRGSSCLK